MAVALPPSVREIVWALAKVAPPVSTVTVALPAPSSVMVSVSTVRLKLAVSLSVMVMFLVPISAPSCRARIAMVSSPSTNASSCVVMVALPEVAPAAIVMLAGVIV